MRILLLNIILLSFLFSHENQKLIDFAHKYTMSTNRDTFKIAYDFANSSIQFGLLKDWERQRYRSINKKELQKHIDNGTELKYVIGLINRSPEYIRLLTMLNQYYKYEREFRQLTPYLTINMSIGNHYSKVPKLKKFLNLLQGSYFEFYDNYYDEDLELAVEYFQKRYGLFVDGKIGPQTRKYLNMSFEDLIRKIKINLEIEMSKKDKPKEYIYVNIPEFKMYYIDDDMEVLSMNVVVGKNKNKTPIFSEKLSYIVFNPEWKVPKNIYEKEYSHKSISTLERRGYYFNEEGQLVQKSGEKNALGLVKFMFPNKFSVYMHDTPRKSLFKKRIRAFSHGCIRLEEPFELVDALNVYSSTDEEKEVVDLDRKIPVYIEYNTAWIDSDGILQIRKDIYDYENSLFPDKHLF